MDKTIFFLEKMADLIDDVIKKDKRTYFQVEEKNLLQVVDFLFNDLHCRLSTATATETYHNIQVLYHFSHDKSGSYFCPRVIIKDKNKPQTLSITPIVKGAEWIEREMFEFWGINFKNHPRMERLLSRDHPQNLDKPLRFRRSV